MCKLFISCGAAAYNGCTSSFTQVNFLYIFLICYPLFYECRQQATINTNKTTTMTNSNKYRNSALFLEQKRLAVQKNLRQLQESSISRDVIRSKTMKYSTISSMCIILE